MSHPAGALFQTNEILSGLYLGSNFSARYRETLDKYGITHVLQVTQYTKTPFPEHYTYQVINILDRVDANIMIHFESAIKFIEEALASGGRVLVHCMAGVSRSATIVIAYLMWKTRCTLAAAWTEVERKRFIIRPNIGFFYQLELFEQMQYKIDVEDERYHALLKRIKSLSDATLKERLEAEKQIYDALKAVTASNEPDQTKDKNEDDDDDIVFVLESETKD
jgi:dual specificity phosphatase 12